MSTTTWYQAVIVFVDPFSMQWDIHIWFGPRDSPAKATLYDSIASQTLEVNEIVREPIKKDWFVQGYTRWSQSHPCAITIDSDKR